MQKELAALCVESTLSVSFNSTALAAHSRPRCNWPQNAEKAIFYLVFWLSFRAKHINIVDSRVAQVLGVQMCISAFTKAPKMQGFVDFKHFLRTAQKYFQGCSV